jgi:hypothetical protein
MERKRKLVTSVGIESATFHRPVMVTTRSAHDEYVGDNMVSNVSSSSLKKIRSKLDLGKEVQANRKLLAAMNFDKILGECGLYFTTTILTEAMNAEDFIKAHGGGGSAEFVLAIHLKPIHFIGTNDIVYHTPVGIDTLRIELRTFRMLLKDMYGINAPKLFHVSKCFLK